MTFTKNHLIFLLLLACAFLAIHIYSKSDFNENLKKSYEKVKVEKEKVRAANDSLDLEILDLRDSLDSLKNKKDTVIIYREKDREESSGKIKDARSKTEKEADSLLTDRFKTAKETFIFVTIADSLKLEHRSLVELHKIQTKELMDNLIINSLLEGKIVNKDKELKLSDEEIALKNTEIEGLKKQQTVIAIKWFAIGIGVTSFVYVLAK